MEIERVVVPCKVCHVKRVVWMQRVLVRFIETFTARAAQRPGFKPKSINYTCIACSR